MTSKLLICRGSFSIQCGKIKNTWEENEKEKGRERKRRVPDSTVLVVSSPTSPGMPLSLTGRNWNLITLPTSSKVNVYFVVSASGMFVESRNVLKRERRNGENWCRYLLPNSYSRFAFETSEPLNGVLAFVSSSCLELSLQRLSFDTHP